MVRHHKSTLKIFPQELRGSFLLAFFLLLLVFCSLFLFVLYEFQKIGRRVDLVERAHQRRGLIFSHMDQALFDLHMTADDVMGAPHKSLSAESEGRLKRIESDLDRFISGYLQFITSFEKGKAGKGLQ